MRSDGLLPLLLCLLCFSITSHAAQKLDTDSIARLVKAYYLSVQPNLSPSVTFSVTEYAIDALWDSLGIQIVNAGSNWGDFICCNATVQPFAGFGLMSGFVQNRRFYYTYTLGSGAVRSIIGRLFFNGDTLLFQETGGFQGHDLFVSKPVGDTTYVYDGILQSFNTWITLYPPSTWGRKILVYRDSRLMVVDSTGQEVVPDWQPLSAGVNTLNPALRGHGGPAHELPRVAGLTDSHAVNLRGQTIHARGAPSVLIDLSARRPFAVVIRRTGGERAALMMIGQ